MCISLWGVHVHHCWTPNLLFQVMAAFKTGGNIGLSCFETRLRHPTILARHEKPAVSWTCGGSKPGTCLWVPELDVFCGWGLGNIDVGGLFSAVFHGKEFWVPFGKSCFWGSSCMWFSSAHLCETKSLTRTMQRGGMGHIMFGGFPRHKEITMDGHIEPARS